MHVNYTINESLHSPSGSSLDAFHPASCHVPPVAQSVFSICWESPYEDHLKENPCSMLRCMNVKCRSVADFHTFFSM